MKIRWTKQARQQIAEITRYIAQDSPAVARQVATRIRDAVRGLEDHPAIGRPVPEFGDPKLRERVVSSYRVLYTVSDDEVRILGVVRGTRKLTEIDEDE